MNSRKMASGIEFKYLKSGMETRKRKIVPQESCVKKETINIEVTVSSNYFINKMIANL